MSTSIFLAESGFNITRRSPDKLAVRLGVAIPDLGSFVSLEGGGSVCMYVCAHLQG